MLDLNPVYNYYSSVYQPQTQTKYDSHKRSELKTIYNNMVKVNKKSPLFKINLTNSTQNYAISLKNAAIGLNNFSSFLSDQQENAFSKLTALSDNSQALGATVITTEYDKLPESLTFSIESLATNQRNAGEPVRSNHLNLPAGEYSFSIKTNGRTYGFNLNVKENDNNLLVQDRIANFLNQTDIGIRAYVQSSGDRSQLIIESDNTGTDNTSNGLLFQIQDNEEIGLVTTYQLNQVEQYPEDAAFHINGMEQTSSSNIIAINHMVEIELRKADTESVTIHFVPDNEDIINKMKDFAQSYNEIIDIATERSDNQRGAKKLLHEIKGITNRHHSYLESVGLNVTEMGRIRTDESLLTQSVSNGNIKKLFSDLSGFKNDIIAKTNDISLDPMNYVDKTVITYPNPQHTYTNPYMPSIYSGMLFNYYA